MIRISLDTVEKEAGLRTVGNNGPKELQGQGKIRLWKHWLR